MFLRFTAIVMMTMASIGAMAEPDRPNILWLSTEDISAHLGCYGDPDAITPTLDTLAEKGLRYDNAFTTAPVCAPNRSAIITGMYQMSIGTHHMRSGGEGTKRSIHPKLPPEIVPFPKLLKDAGYYVTNNSKQDYNFEYEGEIWDASSKYAHWSNRPTNDTPFFAVFNYTNTHEGSVRSNKTAFAQKTARLTDDQRRNPDDLLIPPYHADTPTIRRQWANLHELVTGMDYWVASHLAELEAAGLADDTIVMFWSDHGTGLPRHKRWVTDSGVKVPLIVYVPEKWQSKYGVTPGTVVDELVSSVDFAPTVLNMLGVDIPDVMQGQPFLGDNLPEPRKYVYGGRDRMDERYDMIRFIRDKHHKLVVNYMPFKSYNQYMNTAEKSPVQQEMHKLAEDGRLPNTAAWFIRETKPSLEFYDLEADPHELVNWFDTMDDATDNKEKRYALLGAINDWGREIGDLGLIPEPELARLEEKYGYRYHIYSKLNEETSGFYHLLHGMIPFNLGPELSKYPNMPEFRNLYKQLENKWGGHGMASQHPSIRYWATVGLGRFEKPHPLLVKRLKDRSALVRIAAADALISFENHREAALDILTTELQSEEEWIRLYAVTALDEAGELARPALPLLKDALKDTHNKYVVRIANHAVNVLEGSNNSVR